MVTKKKAKLKTADRPLDSRAKRKKTANLMSERPVPRKAKPARLKERPDPARDLALRSTKAAIEKNGENLRILDVSLISSFTDYFVIASGRSSRQVQAMADAVRQCNHPLGLKPRAQEGYAEGRWILIDYGDVVIHLFLDALREFYDLENLWAAGAKLPIPIEYYTALGSP